MPHTITKVMTTETGHRLTEYAGKCAHLHGHSYRWEVTVTADELDYRGMVVDFSDLKSVMKKVLDPLDHAMILNESDPLVKRFGQNLVDLFISTMGTKARLWIMPFNPTAENLLSYVSERLTEEMLAVQIGESTPIELDGSIDPPEPFWFIHKIVVWETANSYCEWRP